MIPSKAIKPHLITIDILHLAWIINDEYGVSYALYNDKIYKIQLKDSIPTAIELYKLSNNFSTVQYAENGNFTIGDNLISYSTNTKTKMFYNKSNYPLW